MLAAPRIPAASSGDALRTVLVFFGSFARSLHLPERAEHHVRKRPVHRLAHDHRENESRRAIERARHDQHFAVQHKAQQCGGKPGVRIQQRDHRRHIRAADRSDQQHAEDQRDHHHDRKQKRVRRIHHQRHREQKRRGQHRQADDILPLINDRPLRKNFLQFSGRDQAAGKRQRPDNHFQPDFAHPESRYVRNAHVIFRDSDHRRGKRAERVAQRGPLRHGGHVDHAERNADRRADDQRNDDPLVFDHFGIAQRGANGERRAQFRRPARRGAPTVGELSHLIDRIKRTVAMMYAESRSCWVASGLMVFWACRS